MAVDDSVAGDASGNVQLPPWKQAVGYLRGKGSAATSGPGATQDEWRGVFAQMRSKLDALEAQAVAIEAGMAGVGEALMRTQPPMYRRVLVRWWRKETGKRREPVLVRAEGGVGGRIKLEPIRRGAKLRTDRGFGLCADLAKQSVAGYWSLRESRRVLAAQVADLQRVLGRGEARRATVLERVALETARAQAEAMGRLRDVGYVVAEDETEAGSGDA